jgi:hypothetical protein
MRSPYCLCVSVSPLIFLVFYAVRVVLKERRRFVLPRTSCYDSNMKQAIANTDFWWVDALEEKRR